MKRKNSRKLSGIIICALAVSLLLTGCGGQRANSYKVNSGTAAAKQTSDLNVKLLKSHGNTYVPDYNTTYEIFVYSFADSNGDGIGDIKGITNKLDYINDGNPFTISDLGANAIWLTPVCPSTTYHKYDVIDYCNIDSEFGTLDDYRNFLDESLKRGIKVIFDLVMNHTSTEHEWFKSAAAYLKAHSGIEFQNQDSYDKAVKECPYIDYYNFLDSKQEGYAKLPGTDYYYEARFWEGMPDLNLDSEKVREEFKDIVKFWSDLGVEGFRMDAVTSYYTGNTEKNIEVLKWFSEMARSINPNTYIVTEAWTNQAEYAKYYASGIDSTFDFGFAAQDGVIANLARGTEAASLYSKALAAEEKLYKEESQKSGRAAFLNAPFYTNHDINRSAGYYGGDDSVRKTKLAGALNLLMSGNAYVYYGEELGMKGSGKDENKRSPMAWTAYDAEKKDAALCKGPADMDATLDYTPNGTYETEKDNASSIFAYYRDAMQLRNFFPVIGRGKTEVLEDLNTDKVAAFKKTDENGNYESIYIIINMSDEKQAVNIEGASLAAVLLAGDEAVEQDGAAFTLPPYGVAVLR